MRNFYFLFLFFLTIATNAQTVNLFNPANNSLYPSQLYFCPNETFNLKVDAIATSTGDYAMVKDLASNYPLGAGSTPINFPAPGTDKFSESFNIGFDFNFYGKTYKKVVAGSNGRLVFTNNPLLDTFNNNTVFKDRTFSGIPGYNTYAKLPSGDYNRIYRTADPQQLNFSSIFFGYTDLIPSSQNTSVTYLYKNITVGGVNALLVSYQNQIRTNGLGGLSGSAYFSNILLFEDGRIIIYVNNKTEDFYNAILGIQNEDASKSKVPVHSNNAYDYNNGPWKSEGVVWTFVPNQNLTPQFKWTRNGNLLTETSNAFNNFSPAEGDVLKVEVSYYDSLGLQIGATVSDQITFNKIPIPVINFNSSTACVTGVTLSVASNPDLNFQWFMVGNGTVLGTGDSYYATQSGNYFVRVSRKTLPNCFVDSAAVPVNLNSTIPAFNVNNVPLNYCDNSAALSRTINLYDYYAQSSNYTVNFLEGTQTIANPAAFVISANTVKTITINVNDPVSGCSINQNFVIRFDSLPVAINNLSKKYCFGETSIEISQYLRDVAGTNFTTFDYLYSTDGINYTTNSIINPQLTSKIWIKILPKNAPASNCFSVSTLVFSENAKIVANKPTVPLPPQCASATETFDLASLIPQINSSPNVTVSFHQNLQDSQTGANPVTNNFRSGLGYTTLYIRVVDTVLNCVSTDHPEITLLVYLKPKLLQNSLSKKNCAGNVIFNLTQSAASLTDAQAPVTVNLEYYAPNGTLLTPNQITNYNEATFGANPSIKIIYNATCNDLVTYNLSYNQKPNATTSEILICDEISYSLQNFQNSAIGNSSQYTFTDINGNPLPAQFDVTALPKTVQFFIKDIATGCISDPQIVTFIKGAKSPLLITEASMTQCDADFDGKTAFNLDSVKSVFTNDSSASFEYFKDASFSQSISANFTNETAFAQIVYVRITLPTFCPSLGKINLAVNIPTKSSTLLDKYFLCYGETVTIDAGSENISWKWSTGETTQTLNFTKSGSYSVVLTNNNGCSYTHNFIISEENQPKIEMINQTNNSIEVIANGGVKPYRYYFNGTPQSSNILNNPTASSYEIQVESASGCFGPPKTIYFIKINNAFTPNADGINDVWRIENLDKMQQVSIIIADRNGTKVFESNNPAKSEWDGRNNGRAIPSSTYWYSVSWFDAVTQKNEQRQGWILLKNRN